MMLSSLSSFVNMPVVTVQSILSVWKIRCDICMGLPDCAVQMSEGLQIGRDCE